MTRTEELNAAITEFQRSIDRLLDQLTNPSIDRDVKTYIRETIASFRRDVANARVELWNLDQADQARREAIGKSRYQATDTEPVAQPSSGTGYADSLRHKDLTT